MSLMDRGLDLSQPDTITQGELEAFNRHYATRDGRVHPGLNMWIQQGRPDYLKRYRLFARFVASAPTTAVDAQTVKTDRGDPEKAGQAFAGIYLYGMLGYVDGVRYAIVNAQNTGFDQDMCMQGIAVACVHAGPRGMEVVHDALDGFSWATPEPPQFRSGWIFDKSKMLANLNYSTSDLLPGEIERLEQWYGDTIGEVPSWIRFLGRHNPSLLKAWRNRWENLFNSLPNQLLPLTLFQIGLLRGDRAGVRENALLARAWGVGRGEIVHALSAWMNFGGMEMAAFTQAAVGDLIDSWPD